MTKPLFRRTHQSKTNCRCLRGREHLPPAWELGQTARRGFLLALDFCVFCCSVILPEESFGKWKSFQDRAIGQHHTLPSLEAPDGMGIGKKLIPDAFEIPFYYKVPLSFMALFLSKELGRNRLWVVSASFTCLQSLLR